MAQYETLTHRCYLSAEDDIKEVRKHLERNRWLLKGRVDSQESRTTYLIFERECVQSEIIKQYPDSTQRWNYAMALTDTLNVPSKLWWRVAHILNSKTESPDMALDWLRSQLRLDFKTSELRHVSLIGPKRFKMLQDVFLGGTGTAEKDGAG